MILLLSVLLLMTALLDPSVLVATRVDPEVAKLVIALASALVFFLSLVQLRVDWRNRAAAHAHAARILGQAKATCRRLESRAEVVSAAEVNETFRDLDHQLDDLVPIPDELFATLKARHAYKVELSRLISAHPTAPVSVLRVNARWRGLRGVSRGSDESEPA